MDGVICSEVNVSMSNTDTPPVPLAPANQQEQPTRGRHRITCKALGLADDEKCNACAMPRKRRKCTRSLSVLPTDWAASGEASVSREPLPPSSTVPSKLGEYVPQDWRTAAFLSTTRSRGSRSSPWSLLTGSGPGAAPNCIPVRAPPRCLPFP